MTVSIVIPTYNRAEVLVRTLQGLARQSVLRSRAKGGSFEREGGSFDPADLPFEVLVVDDGSTDETASRVEELRPRFPVPLRYLRQPNRKQGAARNLGARESKGRLLVFLGDDTIPVPEFLEAHLESRNGADSRTVVIGYTPWHPSFRQTRFMRYIGEEGWQFGFSLIGDPQDVPFNFFYTSNLSIDRGFFQDHGGFDEDFQEYGWEDIELSFRLKKEGMRIVFNRRAVAHHYHPTRLAGFIRRQHKVGYSAWTFYRKHPELADFLNVHPPPRYSRSQRLRMWLLTHLCSLTERFAWPDLSRFYPDLMSYHYNLGLLQARHERR